MPSGLVWGGTAGKQETTSGTAQLSTVTSHASRFRVSKAWGRSLHKTVRMQNNAHGYHRDACRHPDSPLAHAFSIEPKVLLLDEPFAQIDALTRGVIQEELIQMWNTG